MKSTFPFEILSIMISPKDFNNENDKIKNQKELLLNQIQVWNIKDWTQLSKNSMDLCSPLFKKYLGDNFNIIKNNHGKPIVYLEDGITLHSVQFNISHTKKNLRIAFTTHYHIGIDIEEIGVERKWYSMAKRFYAKEELEQLENFSIEKQKDFFYQLWTLKESITKCLGLPIFLMMKRAQFRIEESQISLLDPSNENQKYFFFHQKDCVYFSIAVTPI